MPRVARCFVASVTFAVACAAHAADAQWFFKWSYLGDVVNITGTKRKLIWWNGWGYYQMPWATWVKGGALDQQITT